MMRLTVFGCVVGLVLAGLLSGCGSSQRDVEGEATPAAPVVLDGRRVPVHAGSNGVRIPWNDLIDALDGADVVLIGETHGHPMGLAAAGAIWEDLLEREGAGPDEGAVLSMEFFGRGTQAALDDYLTGVTDREAFLEAADRSEGNYPAGHAAMVELARRAGARVIGANAPGRYTTRARLEGYGALRGLRASQRALFELPVAEPESDYRDRFFELFRGMMAGHGHGEPADPAELETRIEGFWRAQSVWDATMAGSIARAAFEGGSPVVHVVGRFHVDHEGGLVRELRERMPTGVIRTVSVSPTSALTEEDAGRAEFVILAGE